MLFNLNETCFCKHTLLILIVWTADAIGGYLLYREETFLTPVRSTETGVFRYYIWEVDGMDRLKYLGVKSLQIWILAVTVKFQEYQVDKKR